MGQETYPGPPPASSGGEDPWATAASLIAAEDASEDARVNAILREREERKSEAERQSEEGRQRIAGFLERMHAAGDPGLGEHKLSVPYRRQNMEMHLRQQLAVNGAARVQDEDPDVIIVRGWVLKDASHTVTFRTDGRPYTSDDLTVLSEDGDVFWLSGRAKDGRQRLDQSKVTMEMLVRTLQRNGVTI